MKKHAGKKRQQRLRHRVVPARQRQRNLRRNQAIRFDKGLGCRGRQRYLVDKNKYIGRDQQERDERHRPSRCHVLERNHGLGSHVDCPVAGTASRRAADSDSRVYASSDGEAFCRNSSISSNVAMCPRAPGAVQFSAAAAQLNSSISSSCQPRKSPSKNPPWKMSPAPVVSTARTRYAGESTNRSPSQESTPIFPRVAPAMRHLNRWQISGSAFKRSLSPVSLSGKLCDVIAKSTYSSNSS